MSQKLRVLLIVLLVLISVGLSYYMIQLNEQELLWGYLPLPFWLAVWGAIVLFLGLFFNKHADRSKLMGLSTLSAVFLSLGFPPFPFTPLMFVGFVPLLILENKIAGYRKGASKWMVFKYVYHTFLLWNILTTYWVTNTAFAAGLVAMMANAFLMTVPIVLFHQTKKILNIKLSFAAFISYWITFEYIHLYWEISWPWLTLGHSFAEYPSWIQWYEYTGVFGGTLWILLANVLTYKVVEKKWIKKEVVNVRAYIYPILFVLLPILISLGIYFNYEDKGSLTEVVVVQPNFEPHYEKFVMNGETQLQRFIRLSKSQATAETDYLVFPETSFGGVDRNAPAQDEDIRELRKMVNEYPKLNLVSGISSHKFFKEGEPHTKNTRLFRRPNKEKLYWESYNAAIQISSDQVNMPIYLKSKLVPGAEIFPYSKLFFFIEPLVDKLGGSVAGLGTQDKRDVFFNSSGVGVAPVICYESIYGEYCADYVRNGANALFIVTNDGWWDNTAGHQQHLKFASLRAIETRRSIARSANTGISCFINQRGDILQATKYDEDVAIKGKIALNSNFTFYTKWKDLIARISILLTSLLLLNTFVKGRIGDN